MQKQEIDALIERLQGLEPGDDGGEIDDERVAQVLHANAHPVYQVVFDRGHGQGLSKGTSDRDEWKRKAEAADSRIEELRTKINDLEDKAPNAEALKRQYQDEIDEIKRDMKAELEKTRQTLIDERTSNVRSRLRNRLVREGVDPDYAEVLVEKPEVRDRIRPNDEGKVEILQKGKDIPVAETSDRSAVDLLAHELKGSTPAKFIVKNGDRGGAGRGDGGGGESGFDYSKLRENLSAEQEKKAERTSTTGAKRLGVSFDK